MITAALCDDDRLFCKTAAAVIEDTAGKITGNGLKIEVFHTGEELIEEIRKKGSYDIYIIDINMPGISGIEAAAEIRTGDKKGKIIFCSESEDSIAEAMKLHPFTYILKNEGAGEIAREFRLAIEECGQLRPKTTILRSRLGAHRVKTDDILYVERADRKPLYHIKGEKKIEGRVLRGPFREAVEELLAFENFVLPGNGIAVNLKEIECVGRELLVFSDGHELPVSSDLSGRVLKCWEKYWKNEQAI